MLSKFKVKNFMNFEKELVLDLSSTNQYEFNSRAIKNGISNTALIYGMNGSGKSNLGLAVFDIALNLTDKQKNLNHYRHYLNLKSDQNAKFTYEFNFNGANLVYKYEKSGVQKMVIEDLYINDKHVLSYDHIAHVGFTSLLGTETLNTDLNEKNISFVKYIGSNAILSESDENRTFYDFISFVDNMLLFSSLEKNFYLGYRLGGDTISRAIVEQGHLKGFEDFLREIGIDYSLVEGNVDGETEIFCDFGNNKKANFFSIASRGTCSVSLFYYWLINMAEVSFVFIDEFDAFYHNELAKFIVSVLLEQNAQAVLTTHNTSIMTNSIMRPDCLYNLQSNTIHPFSKLTNKDIRKAHNIEKMYKAGSFNV